MTLRRRDEFQAAVFVLMVVPAHELLRPGPRFIYAAERSARIVGPVFAGAEQRLREWVVVTHTRPAERGHDPQVFQSGEHRRALHRAAVIRAMSQ